MAPTTRRQQARTAPLLLCAFSTCAAAAPPASAAAAAPPSWPAALHLEGSYHMTSVVTMLGPGYSPTRVTGNGTVVFDTLGDAAKPGESLSHEKAIFEMTTDGSVVPSLPSVEESWQACPSHASFQNSSTAAMPGTPASTTPCSKTPVSCTHRSDPISLAVAACKSWTRDDTLPMPGPEPGLSDEHYRGSGCNFTAPEHYRRALEVSGPLPPGMTTVGSFDVWYSKQDIVAFVNKLFITSKGLVTINNTETVVMTFTDNSPDPAVFRHHCIPS